MNATVELILLEAKCMWMLNSMIDLWGVCGGSVGSMSINACSCSSRKGKCYRSRGRNGQSSACGQGLILATLTHCFPRSAHGFGDTCTFLDDNSGNDGYTSTTSSASTIVTIGIKIATNQPISQNSHSLGDIFHIECRWHRLIVHTQDPGVWIEIYFCVTINRCES